MEVETGIKRIPLNNEGFRNLHGLWEGWRLRSGVEKISTGTIREREREREGKRERLGKRAVL